MAILTIDDDTFHDIVEKAQEPVLVDFWAPWCGPCVMLSSVLEEVEKQLQPGVKVVKINIDDNPQTPTKFGIRSITTLILFHKGQAIMVLVGLQTKEDLVSQIINKIKEF